MYLAEDHGIDEDVREDGKQVEEDIKPVHEMSKVLSSVAVEQVDYILSSILSVLYYDAFDVVVMKAHIQRSSDCRLVTNCSDSRSLWRTDSRRLITVGRILALT